VIDFTTQSDRQIAEAFKKETNLCGRFLHTQLDQDLVFPKEKSNIWMAASAALVAFVGLGNDQVYAQTSTVNVEQREKKAENKYIISNSAVKIITGNVVDEVDYPIPDVTVMVKGAPNGVQTDFDGNFNLEAETGEILQFSYSGMLSNEIIIDERQSYKVTLKYDSELLYAVGGPVLMRRTFFGRIFHSIGNIFR